MEPPASPRYTQDMASSPQPTPRVFLSYTAQDLVEHATVAAKVVRRMEWVVVDHRDWSARGLPALQWCRQKVRSCQVLVVLVAHRYGWVPSREEGGDGERSVVWLEVEEARAHGIPVLPLLVDESAPWPPPHMEGLKDPVAGEQVNKLKRILAQSIRATFSTPESLEAPLLQALVEVKDRLRAPPPAPSAAAGASADGLTRYRRRVEEQNRHLELLGLGDQLHVRLPIGEAYVTLRATLPMALQRMETPGTFKGAHWEEHADGVKRDLPLHEVFQEAAQRALPGVVLLGDPGCGKTTAARHLAWRCADPTQGPASLGLPRDMLPVFLRLRRLGEARLSEGLEGFLVQELQTVHLSDHQGLGRRLYRHARLLWILDGLDEVADPATRARVSRWIDEAARFALVLREVEKRSKSLASYLRHLPVRCPQPETFEILLPPGSGTGVFDVESPEVKRELEEAARVAVGGSVRFTFHREAKTGGSGSSGEKDLPPIVRRTRELFEGDLL